LLRHRTLVRAHPPRIYNTQRLAGQPPSIDGHLDDEAWKEGEWAVDYTQQLPVEGGAPSQKTELKILYDGERSMVPPGRPLPNQPHSRRAIPRSSGP